MISVPRSAISLCVGFVVLAGCASTKVTQQTPIISPGLARPDQIWVYDFIADPARIPADSSISAGLSPSSTPLTATELDAGRQLGVLIASALASNIRDMGFRAVQAGSDSKPRIGDGVIRGYLVSVESGSAVKRFVVGFGAGSSELDTVVEGYVMTPEGLRKLGSGALSSSGSKGPGMLGPAAVTLATGNPIGLIVVGGTKLYGEASGRNALEGRAKTADAIAEQLRIRFQDRGWMN
jgi:hypothetical protein